MVSGGGAGFYVGRNNQQRRKAKAKARKQRRVAPPPVRLRSGGLVPEQVVDSGFNRMLAASQQAGLTDRRPPEWVDSSAAAVCADLPRFAQVASAHALESMICERFVPLYDPTDEESAGTFWAGTVLDKVASTCVGVIRESEDAAERLGAWYLLRGLAGCVPEPFAARLLNASSKVRKRLGEAALAEVPDWLGRSAESTGEAWVTRNSYGDEFGLFGRFTGPDSSERIYAFNFDDSRYNHLSLAGSFPSLDEAVATWNEHTGTDASSPEPVTRSDQLVFTAHREDPFDLPDPVTTESMRAELYCSERRLADLLAALRKHGVDAPPPENRYQDVDLETPVDAFLAWCEEQGLESGEREDVYSIAEAWIGGSVPGTEYSISPKRIDHGCILIADGYIQEYAEAAFKILPHWYRFCGARLGLSEERIAASVAAAPATPGEAFERERRRN
jgi:hypothetical protein